MRLAVMQCLPPSPPGFEAGLRLVEDAARRAAAAGADLVICPEMTLTGYAIGADAVRALAAPADGPAGRAVAAIARDAGVAIVYGAPEAAAAGVCNVARLVDRGGTLRATCRKTHLYGAVDRAQFVAGDALAAPVDLDGWRVGLAVCYDIEFPEVARALALAGAEAILVPTANMAPFESVATRLVPARAEENGVFVAYANYRGGEADFVYCGLSCIVGPDGGDLARAGPDDTALIVADLDRGLLERTRATATHLADRRPDLYGAPARRRR